MNVKKWLAAAITFAAAFATFTQMDGAAWGLWLLVAIAVISGVIFWGDGPNVVIFFVSAVFFPMLLWSTGTPLTAAAFPFWGIVGVLFWKGASTIRCKMHPKEYNGRYLDLLKGRIGEVDPDEYD
jgi:hypothetical protein